MSMESQINGFPPTKLRAVSFQTQIAIRTMTRLYCTVTKITNAYSISSESRRASTRWSLARARFSDRQRKRTNRPEHREQSVLICIVYFNVRFEWQNRYARIQTLRAARYRWVLLRLNWLNEFLAN